jgi:hypothetical protein
MEAPQILQLRKGGSLSPNLLNQYCNFASIGLFKGGLGDFFLSVRPGYITHLSFPPLTRNWIIEQHLCSGSCSDEIQSNFLKLLAESFFSVQVYLIGSGTSITKDKKTLSPESVPGSWFVLSQRQPRSALPSALN